LIVPEQKLARGGSAALVMRETVAYITSSASLAAYTITGLVRHLMVTTGGAITITLPAVSECAGEIFTVYLDSDGGTDITITDAGDDPDFTDITIADEDHFSVFISNGVRWMYIQTGAAA